MTEGIGRYARRLLARGPVGLSYRTIMQMVQRRFPGARLDANHLRWYAHTMRESGQVLPTARERSRWTHKGRSARRPGKTRAAEV